MSDEEVKALAEKMGEAKLGPPRGTKILASALMYQGDLEALARVAMEFCEARQAVRKESERRKKSWIPK